MPEINAALGISQLKKCDEWLRQRGAIAAQYRNEIKAQRSNYRWTSHHLFPIRIPYRYVGGGVDGGVNLRDRVKRDLSEAAIGVQIHYKPIHKLSFYTQPNRFYPNAFMWGEEELSLPCHASMSNHDVDYVIENLRKSLKKHGIKEEECRF